MSDSDLLVKAREIVLAESKAVHDMAGQLDESLQHVLNLLLNCKGHVLITGAGTSRMVAQRMAHLMSCCGIPALSINSADALHGGAGAVKENDVLYVISKGGQSREINNFVDIAKSRGAQIVAHTENPDSPLAKKSDAVYWIKAPQGVDPFGMVATGSSLVNAAACDVICVLLMQLSGYSREAFGQTHPEGAVGEKLKNENEGEVG